MTAAVPIRLLSLPASFRRACLWLAGGLALGLGMASAAVGATGADDERTPQEMVRDTSDAMLRLIEEAKGYAEEDPERFYRQVEALLAPVVDFEGFARSVMGRGHYQDATPEQRERFAENFKWGLVRTYALALTDFDGGELAVLPQDRPSRNPRRETVTMEVRLPAGDVYPVVYSLVQDDDGRWQVRNLIVNGVNMGLTYRSQFKSAMNDPQYGGDLDEVIDAWGTLLKAEVPGLESDEQAGTQET